jgi:molybdopterin/thiamine biosynthesis adenylyltransferase
MAELGGLEAGAQLERYSRQILLAQIGRSGQESLLRSRVALIGCGALGTVIADLLVRAGVGHVRIVDRDYIELSNLQRQTLFDEEDIRRELPKAVAAAEKLGRVNSQVQVEAVVADVNPDNVEAIIRDAQVVLDGTDNFEARLLINDACIKRNIPWVYGGVVATHGMSMVIRPHLTPCFRCFVAEVPPPGSRATCDTVGVLAPAVNIVASLEVTEGLKLLLGREEELHGRLAVIDVWHLSLDLLELGESDAPCPACGLGHFDFLEAKRGTYVTSLCGRDAVQISVRAAFEVPFDELAGRLARVGDVAFNKHMLRFRVNSYELTVFPDGRTIVKGTTDENVARSLYATYIGA